MNRFEIYNDGGHYDEVSSHSVQSAIRTLEESHFSNPITL